MGCALDWRPFFCTPKPNFAQCCHILVDFLRRKCIIMPYKAGRQKHTGAWTVLYGQSADKVPIEHCKAWMNCRQPCGKEAFKAA